MTPNKRNEQNPQTSYHLPYPTQPGDYPLWQETEANIFSAEAKLKKFRRTQGTAGGRAGNHTEKSGIK